MKKNLTGVPICALTVSPVKACFMTFLSVVKKFSFMSAVAAGLTVKGII